MALNALQEEFLEWLLDEREPTGKEGGKGTQNQWARSKDLSVSTVATWKTQKEFFTEWQIAADAEGVGPTQLREVRNAMYAKAQSGDVRAAEVWIKLASKTMPTMFEEASEPEKEVSTYSDQELEEALKEELLGGDDV